MNKKLTLYIGLAAGVLLIFLGGGLLYLKEKSAKKTAAKNPKKVEVVISTSAAKPHIANGAGPAEIKSAPNIPQKRKIAFHPRRVYIDRIILVTV